jgi:hypothetical protein
MCDNGNCHWRHGCNRTAVKLHNGTMLCQHHFMLTVKERELVLR